MNPGLTHASKRYYQKVALKSNEWENVLRTYINTTTRTSPFILVAHYYGWNHALSFVHSRKPFKPLMTSASVIQAINSWPNISKYSYY